VCVYVCRCVLYVSRRARQSKEEESEYIPTTLLTCKSVCVPASLYVYLQVCMCTCKSVCVPASLYLQASHFAPASMLLALSQSILLRSSVLVCLPPFVCVYACASMRVCVLVRVCACLCVRVVYAWVYECLHEDACVHVFCARCLHACSPARQGVCVGM